MINIVLAFGSNLGDSRKLLFSGVATLEEFNIYTRSVSPIVSSAPLGGMGQADYLNLVVLAQTDLSPVELLRCCNKIEENYGRRRLVKWEARTLDIDIIAYGDLLYESKDLTIPHPLAFERSFVLVPWGMVDSEAILPGVGLVSELAIEAGKVLPVKIC